MTETTILNAFFMHHPFLFCVDINQLFMSKMKYKYYLQLREMKGGRSEEGIFQPETFSYDNNSEHKSDRSLVTEGHGSPQTH